MAGGAECRRVLYESVMILVIKLLILNVQEQKIYQVWDGIAYQTSGALKINNFIINKNGNIVSKRKSIIETDKNRFLNSV